MLDASRMFAIMPEKSPIDMLLMMNGLRMNPQVAPVSFIVCSRKRFEYIDRRTRLLMSDHDIIVSKASNTNIAAPTFLILSFTEFMRSF